MTLHLIQKSPFTTSTLDDCLNMINPSDAILLMQDGAYAVNDSRLLSADHAVYVLTDDIEARGITTNNDQAKGISYSDFVELCTQHTNTISWY